MHVNDVIRAIEDFAPPSTAYSWDRAGLHIGAPDDAVTKVLVALTPSQAVLKSAKRAKADMIVVHHPLIWEPLTTLRSDDAAARLCLDIAEAGLACYSAHTNLDVARGGVNDILFSRLELRNRRSLFPVKHSGMIKLVSFVPEPHLEPVRNAVAEAGAGTIGDYTHCSFSAPGTGTFKPGEASTPYSGARGIVNHEAEQRFETVVPARNLGAVLEALRRTHPYEEVAYDVYPLENPDADLSLGLIGSLARPMALGAFAEQVRGALQIEHVRFTGKANSKIRRVAVMGGAGGGSTPQIPSDVDVFVTGDVKYHEAVDALERGLHVIDAGHHGTEKFVVPWLAAFLKKRVAGLKVVTYMEPDPFTAIVGT